jgi:hypothetical protein
MENFINELVHKIMEAKWIHEKIGSVFQRQDYTNVMNLDQKTEKKI